MQNRQSGLRKAVRGAVRGCVIATIPMMLWASLSSAAPQTDGTPERIVLDGGAVVLEGPDGVIAEAEGARLVVERRVFASASGNQPQIDLTFPDGTHLSVGVYDARVQWVDEVARGNSPGYALAAAEWRALMAALALADQVDFAPKG